MHIILYFFQTGIFGHPAGPYPARQSVGIKPRQRFGRHHQGSGSDQRFEMPQEITRQLAVAMAYHPDLIHLRTRLTQVMDTGCTLCFQKKFLRHAAQK